ncbi:unnamed protein product, partial [Prorocentrum cordatum]
RGSESGAHSQAAAGGPNEGPSEKANARGAQRRRDSDRAQSGGPRPAGTAQQGALAGTASCFARPESRGGRELRVYPWEPPLPWRAQVGTVLRIGKAAAAAAAPARCKRRRRSRRRRRRRRRRERRGTAAPPLTQRRAAPRSRRRQRVEVQPQAVRAAPLGCGASSSISLHLGVVAPPSAASAAASRGPRGCPPAPGPRAPAGRTSDRGQPPLLRLGGRPRPARRRPRAAAP